MKKELPKYFVIKQDDTNPLWDKYIEWLNKEYNQNYKGYIDGYYYGYDGNNDFNGTNGWDNIMKFQNNPTELTLEEWDEIINGETFSLGEQVGVSNINVEIALRRLKTDDYKYYYIGKTKNGRYIVEDNDGDLGIYKYICKIPHKEEEKDIENIPPLTDEEIVKIRKLIG